MEIDTGEKAMDNVVWTGMDKATGTDYGSKCWFRKNADGSLTLLGMKLFAPQSNQGDE